MINMSKKTTTLKSVSSSTGGDLFNNPAITNALKNMSPEQLEQYQAIGEQLYSNVDIVKGEILSNKDPPTEEKLSYIISGLKSGLLPSDMSEDEIMLMIEYYGDDWFEKFGINKNDIGNMAKNIFQESEKYKKCGRNQKCPCGSGKKFKVCHLSKVSNIPKFVQTKTLSMFSS